MLDRDRRGFLIAAALTVVTALAALLALPHNRDVGSLWELLAKLVPFLCGVEAIARFDIGWSRRFKLLPTVLVPLCFLVYFVYFVPRTFYWGGVKTDSPDSYPSLYYNILLLTPFLILAFCVAYRLGGGVARTVRRMGYGMLLLMLSGIEDLAFLVVNDLRGTPFHPIPEHWNWASHMQVFLGHWPSKHEAFAFIAVHLVLAGTVLFLPDRVVDRIKSRIFKSTNVAQRQGESHARP